MAEDTNINGIGRQHLTNSMQSPIHVFPQIFEVKHEDLACGNEESPNTQMKHVSVLKRTTSSNDPTKPELKMNFTDLDASKTSSNAPTPLSKRRKLNNTMLSLSHDDELTVTINIGDVDISCLNEEIDLGTEVKITGLGDTLPIPSPIKVARKPKDRDRTKIVRAATIDIDSSKSCAEPKDRDKSKKVSAAVVSKDAGVGNDKYRPKVRDLINRIIPTMSVDVDNIVDDNTEDYNIVDDNIEDDNIKDDNIEDGSVIDDTPFYGNRIIIGGKTKTKCSSDLILSEHLFNSKIVLEDCLVKLKESKRFCHECNAYFASSSALDKHNVVKHASNAKTEVVKTVKKVLGPRECGICNFVFSNLSNMIRHINRKHDGLEKYRKMFPAKQSSGKKKNKLSDKEKVVKINNKVDKQVNDEETETSANIVENYCSHCEKVFPNNGLLVEHLYSLLTPENDMHKTVDLQQIRNEVIREVKTDVATNEEDLDKIREDVIKEARCRLGIVNNSDVMDFETYEDSINDDTFYKCLKCDEELESQVDLEKHQLDHVNIEARNAKDFLIKIENLSLTQIEKLTKKRKAPKRRTDENLYLKCPVCSLYFDPKKVNRLDTHMRNHHDGQDGDLNLYQFEGVCQICHTSHENVHYYNKHVTAHIHSKLRLLNKVRKPQSRLKDMFEFKCKICKEKFSALDEATTHIEGSHPDTSTVGNIQKINILKVTKHCMSVYHTIHNPPVPKNVLFKCDLCNVNFFTTFAATIHIAKCPGPRRYWRCPDCYNCFSLQHKEMHEKQHLYSDKFQVHSVGDKNLNNRVLSKCPKCAVHFVEVKFWSHYHDCGREPPNAVYCGKCDFLVDARHAKTHIGAHSKVRTEDFIVIEYEIPGEVKQKYDDKESLAEKSKYVDPDSDDENVRIQMMYCSSCKSYINNVTRHQNSAHFENRCQKLPKKTCNECGLRFTYRSMFLHKRQHDQGFSLTDVAFYDVKFKQIDPPLPQFPQCPVCSIHFFDEDERGKHSCNETASKNCDFCKLDFAESCFKMHVRFHTYADARVDMPFCRKAIAQIQKMLLSKQNKLFTLYQCVDCEVVLTEEKVKPHQKLVFECVTMKNLNKKCPHCKLSFNCEDYHAHLRRHDDDKYSRRNMKIVPFDRRSDVVEVNKTSDKYVESNRFIYYKCAACDQCLEEHKLTSPHSCKSAKSWCPICRINLAPCRIKKHQFEHTIYPDMNADTIKIIIINENIAKAKKRYKRNSDDETTEDETSGDDVSSSDDSAPMIDGNVAADVTKATTSNNDVKKKTNVISKGKGQDKSNKDKTKENGNDSSMSNAAKEKADDVPNSLYKCTCGLHFLTEIGIYGHFSGCCNKKARKQICTKCNLLFTPPILFNHIVTHHAKNRAFTPKIIELSPKCLTDRDVVYKCDKCDVHFLAKTFAETHYAKCNGDGIDPCELCGLQFDITMMAYHKRRHHLDKMFVRDDFDVVVIGAEESNEVTNSGDSSTKTSKTDATNKNHQDKSAVDGLNKDKYVLAFKGSSKSTEVNAKSKNKDDEVAKNLETVKEKINSKDDQVPNENNESIVKVLDKDDEEDNVVYKCVPCDVFFVSAHAIKWHIDNGHYSSHNIKFCKKCNVTFQGYNRHVEIHHESPDFSFENVVIKNIWTSPPKKSANVLYRCGECDIYCLTADSLYRHALVAEHRLKGPARRCEGCKKFFVMPTQLRQHEETHHKEMNLNFEDFEVKTYPLSEKTDEDEKYSHKLYKCLKCGVCTMNRKENTAHHKSYVLCPPQKVDKCKDCGLKFMRSTFLEHTRYHHHVRNFKLEELKIINGTSVLRKEKKSKDMKAERRIYKCKSCALHYFKKLDCLRHVTNHVTTSEELKRKCRRCNIVFHSKSLKLHRLRHHRDRKLKAKDLLVNEYDPDNLRKADRIAFTMYGGRKSVVVSDDVLAKLNEGSLIIEAAATANKVSE